MTSNIAKFKEELDRLISDAEMMRISLAMKLGMVTEKSRAKFKDVVMPEFRDGYEQWYSIAIQVVKQLTPTRLLDFTRLYRDDKRKITDYSSYGLADYMIGLRSTRGSEVVVDGKAAFPKFEQQLNILKGARQRLESSLYDMVEIVQADLFDSELDAASELGKKGFTRGAGAVAGVVLERHLGRVCDKHNVKPRKAAPSINDFNQALKDGNVIDAITWRSIQHLADIRNLCDHAKSQEPTKDQVNDLIQGVSKIIKTIF